MAIGPDSFRGESILELHSSLVDPAMNGMNFLNEIMKKHPTAISFAPGAPNVALYDVDILGSIDQYLAYLQERQGLDAASAKRLLYEYGPAKGLINDLIAQALRADGIANFDPQEIVVTVGAQEGIFVTLRTLFRSADDILAITSPAYVGAIGAVRILGIEPLVIRDTGAGPDLDQLEEALRQLPQGKRLRAMYVAPDHSNPSGSVMDASARRRLLSLAVEHRFFIIEDTAYAFTAVPDECPPALKTLDRGGRVILIGTFAKIALPGVRVGYVATDQWVSAEDGEPRRLADMIATVKSMITVNTSPISQAIVGGMLLNSGVSMRKLGEPHARLYQKNLEYMLNCLDRYLRPDGEVANGICWDRPSGGFFVRVELPVLVDDLLLDRSAANFDVLWTPMSMFYIGGGGERELRLSCSYLPLAKIEEGVKRFAAFARSVAP